MNTELKQLTDARRVLEQLEDKRESLASRFASIERDRAAIVLQAMTGDKAAKQEADRLAAELANISTDAVDVEAALKTARANLAHAQAGIDTAKLSERAEAAKVIRAGAATDAKEFDRLAEAMVAILRKRRARRDELRKLGMISDASANGVSNKRPILCALMAAGLLDFVPDLNSLALTPGNQRFIKLAAADANLFGGTDKMRAA